VVVVVVADSTGCNGSASRLTRRTRLDLSTYRKHRERGGQETPTISYCLVFLSFLPSSFLSFFLSFLFSVSIFAVFPFFLFLFFLSRRLSRPCLAFLAGVVRGCRSRENCFRVGDTERKKRGEVDREKDRQKERERAKKKRKQ